MSCISYVKSFISWKNTRQIRDVIMYISIINTRKDNTIFVCLNKFNTQHNDAGRAVHLQQWNKK
jgi:hypothetical protein